MAESAERPQRTKSVPVKWKGVETNKSPFKPEGGHGVSGGKVLEQRRSGAAANSGLQRRSSLVSASAVPRSVAAASGADRNVVWDRNNAALNRLDSRAGGSPGTPTAHDSLRIAGKEAPMMAPLRRLPAGGRRSSSAVTTGAAAASRAAASRRLGVPAIDKEYARTVTDARRLAGQRSVALGMVLVTWALLCWFTLVYGSLIYQLLGDQAQAAFLRDWGIGLGMENANQWKAVIKEAVQARGLSPSASAGGMRPLRVWLLPDGTLR
jgi:hypothetical protein